MEHQQGSWIVEVLGARLVTKDGKDQVEYIIRLSGIKIKTTSIKLQELDAYIRKTYAWHSLLPPLPGRSILFPVLPRSHCNTQAQKPERLKELSTYLQSVMSMPEAVSDLKIFRLIGFPLPSLPEEASSDTEIEKEELASAMLKEGITAEQLMDQVEGERPPFLPKLAMGLHLLPMESRMLIADLYVAVAAYWRCDEPIIPVLFDGHSTLILEDDTVLHARVADHIDESTIQDQKEETLVGLLLEHLQVPPGTSNAMVMHYRMERQESRSKRWHIGHASKDLHNIWENDVDALLEKACADESTLTMRRKAKEALSHDESSSDFGKVEEEPRKEEPVKPKKKKKPLVTISGATLRELRKEDIDARKAIVWDMLVMAISHHQGLDADVHSTVVWLTRALDVESAWLEDAEANFASILYASLDEKPGSKNTAVTKSNTRWLKIGLGAAVGGTILLAAGVVASPLLIPALGGLVATASLTAGAVGFSTMATGLAMGSSLIVSAGSPVVIGLFGVAGATVFSMHVHKLTKFINVFYFVQIPKELPKGASTMWSIDAKVELAVDTLATVAAHAEDVVNPMVVVPKITSVAQKTAQQTIMAAKKASQPSLSGAKGEMKKSSVAEVVIEDEPDVPVAPLIDDGKLPDDLEHGEVGHELTPWTFQAPGRCGVCAKVLWGLRRPGAQCKHCDFVAHAACAEQAAKLPCSRSRKLQAVDVPTPATTLKDEKLEKAVKDNGHEFVQVTLVKPSKCIVCHARIWGMGAKASRCKHCDVTSHGEKKCLSKAMATHCGPTVSKSAGTAHKMVSTQVLRPSWCDLCKQFAWNPAALMRCAGCGFLAHSGQCAEETARLECSGALLAKKEAPEDPHSCQSEEETENKVEQDLTDLDDAIRNAFKNAPDLEAAKKAKAAIDQLDADLEDILDDLHEDVKSFHEQERLEKDANKKKERPEPAIASVVDADQERRLKVCICCSGWIWTEADYKNTWVPVRQAIGDTTEVYGLQWETPELKALGKALMSMLTSKLAKSVIKYYIAKTILAATLSALAWPLFFISSSSYISNPWNVVAERARKCGRLLAATLIEQVHGRRPVTLVGFSHGARLIFYCLEELKKRNAVGIVENVFLFGAAVTADASRWQEIRTVVSGRLVNGYTTTDWILGLLHRTANYTRSIAGLGPVECPDIENWNLTHVVKGHLLYKQKIGKILDEVRFTESSPVKEKLWGATTPEAKPGQQLGPVTATPPPTATTAVVQDEEEDPCTEDSIE